MKYRVLVSDPLAEEGIDILKEFGDVDVNTGLTEDQLVAVIGDYDALLVRSGTEVTARVIDAGAKLKFIGRAGAGVDNIDTEAATRRGIVVANAPEGNTLAATEHTMAMMLSLARNIPQATASLKKGEWKRSKFMGVELNDKVLGVMGFGRIGREVAKRAQAMEMKCIAYDPFITKEKAATLGVEMVPLDELFRRADVITVHTPLIKETRHVINAETIATMKDGVRLINCARGGIIDEQALADGIASGKVAGAALDVFEAEPPTDSPVIGLEKVIITPHLGASTVEAQKNVAISVANQCISVLSGGAAKYVVNAPMIPAEQQAVVEPYAALAQKMGSLLIQLIEGRLESIKITYGGEAATLPNTKFITRVILKGMLDPILQAPVNFVNAEFVAKERGIRLSETTTEEAHGFRNMISITAKTDRMSESVSGSVSAPDHARIVSIGGYMTDLTPTGHVVISRHTDKPGVIGKAATILGRVNVNIAGMQVGRHKPGEEALMVLTVDSAVPAEAMDEIKKIDGIHTAKHAEI
ncbi:phosphoglycerate dehydrogenase [Methanoculleus sp.]|uniref:phosphoglycerate dehydrogenase n=1 Tax=Methanoculleus sp. TaxID=90427 RepID=UPI0025F633F2|nr:phosphoglycerate dehydrogenase [Methanoculleus sp.]MCK9318267.1 phosphoglycerate dehydrogenase [Methanoculleus sp.]MDD2254812.1 phosphoglycerate dehydrogenase [Methanoculleus sp.]MDD2786914.1 phosphoglycerate dehydrogenase [Methanoculleus sp.]MDD3216910.1 phosphoglycerate dehydrogenase [Methanoculleus sp.]MDD4314683.1 phosphoglycerate dehydrogenase [Methanoculleus sp.]